jgi:diketogulonate reductase-like aldo/keto reductase
VIDGISPVRHVAAMHSPTATQPLSPATTVMAHGAAIPVIGLGTGAMSGGATTREHAESVTAALRAGYRHIDTARKYGSEEGVGEGIRASGIARENIFVTTKVSHENLHAADFARSLDESLKALSVDYVDLLLVHWPNPKIALDETMQALAHAKRQKLTRHIGVANFTVALLEQAVRLCPEPLVTNQVEFHPYLDQSKVYAACRRLGLILTAHCPLGRGRLMDDPVLTEIGRRHGKTVAQVALRWAIQQDGVVPIPRSSNPQRIAANVDIFDFRLSAEDMTRIDALKRPGSRIADPAGRAPAWDS